MVAARWHSFNVVTVVRLVHNSSGILITNLPAPGVVVRSEDGLRVLRKPGRVVVRLRNVAPMRGPAVVPGARVPSTGPIVRVPSGRVVRGAPVARVVRDPRAKSFLKLLRGGTVIADPNLR